MEEFIIGGPGFSTRLVEAATQSIALRLAIRRAFMARKHDVEDLRECWAQLATLDRKWEHNLLPYESPPIWESNIIDRSWA